MTDRIRQIIAFEKQIKSGKLSLGAEGLTEIPEEVFELKHLKYLKLNGNRITRLDDIGNLSELHTLDLHNNQIADADFLSQLPQLRSLDLSRNPIGDWSFLEQLSSLESLKLLDNVLPNTKLLDPLSQLKRLHLRTNKIQHFDLQNLKQLEVLSLINNQISDIRSLEHLGNLKMLDLHFNQIDNIYPLRQLKQLKFLSLDYNDIREIRFLKNLTQLNHLSLTDTLLKDISELERLVDLEVLQLNDNQLDNIRILSSLDKLHTLSLSNNKLRNIQPLEKLKGLKSLKLAGNPLTDVDSLQDLTNLEHLDLRHTKVTDLSAFYPLLKNTALDISLHEDESGLRVSQNSIVTPPPEIISQGKKSVLEWFEANKVGFNEVKLILIGDPKAGKTSILKRLKDDTFDPNEPQTDGINIEDVIFQEEEHGNYDLPLKTIIAHIWDFGGQEIMNSTHQFFLTNRSVYVLVIDARNDNQVANQVRNWVQRIRTTGGNSPIIVVANQIDVNRGFGFENESILRKDFPQIKAFVKVSCRTRENLESLIDHLGEWLPKAEMFETAVDEKWLPVKAKMEEETKLKPFISESRFLEICDSYDLTSEVSRKSLISFLHDLGLLLHFEGLRKNLSEYFVLDPYWITYGVYQILTSNFAGSCKGIVAVDMLDFIVNKEPDKQQAYRSKDFFKIEYSTGQRLFLVDILHEFKLCFYVNDRKYFIIPDLLETEVHTSVTDPITHAAGALRFVYQYNYLPKSIIPEIMVEAHHMLEKIWRTGCVLAYDGSKALVNADQNRIYITVDGDHKKKREFMSVLRYIIDQINARLSDTPQMQIPLPDFEDQFVSYRKLIRMEKDGDTEYSHYSEKEDRSLKYPIAQLLEGISPVNELEAIRQEMSFFRQSFQSGIEKVIQQQSNHYEYLATQLNPSWKSELLDSIKNMQSEYAESVERELTIALGEAFEDYQGQMDEQLQHIYQNLTTAGSNTQLKLKIGLPLLVQMVSGLNIEGEFDLKRWSENMYKKYELPLFKVMGKI